MEMDSAGPMNDHEQESSDSTFWYVQKDGKQIGPIFFQRLRQMAQQGDIGADDLIRKGKTDAWVRAESLASLPLRAVNLEPATVEKAIAPPPVDRRQNQPGAVAKFLISIREWMGDFRDNIWQAIADRNASLRVVVSWIALIGVTGSLLVVLANHLPFSWPFRSSPIAIYSSIWNELRAKRSAQTTSADWDAFADAARQQVAPIIARLEKTASSDNRMEQQLLWAGRDCLPKMLADARQQESPSEEKFAGYLRRAIWLNEGKDLNGRLPYLTSTVSPFAFGSDFMQTIFVAAFIIVDVIVLVWFLGKWRKTSKTASVATK